MWGKLQMNGVLSLNKEFEVEKNNALESKALLQETKKSSFPNVAYSVPKSYNSVSHPNPYPPLALK